MEIESLKPCFLFSVWFALWSIGNTICGVLPIPLARYSDFGPIRGREVERGRAERVISPSLFPSLLLIRPNRILRNNLSLKHLKLTSRNPLNWARGGHTNYSGGFVFEKGLERVTGRQYGRSARCFTPEENVRARHIPIVIRKARMSSPYIQV